MEIKQLGNGGGFDFNQTNSSFLINVKNENREEAKDTYLLFDCGYNVMAKLQNSGIDISKIDNVFISHMDEDHIGNLKMLIYYRYFIHKQKTNIIYSTKISKQIKEYLIDMDNELIGGQSINAKMITFDPVNEDSINTYGTWALYTTSIHHGKLQGAGAIIFSKGTKKGFFISGDTKASATIEKEVNKQIKQHDLTLLKFHDFSNWDCVTRNVHACNADYEIEYSTEWRKTTIKYHNGEPFNEKWQQGK